MCSRLEKINDKMLANKSENIIEKYLGLSKSQFVQPISIPLLCLHYSVPFLCKKQSKRS